MQGIMKEIQNNGCTQDLTKGQCCIVEAANSTMGLTAFTQSESSIESV